MNWLRRPRLNRQVVKVATLTVLRVARETGKLDRDSAGAFYDALASREPSRIEPFLADDVDWLIVGPEELFAFCGQRYGKAAVLETYRQISRAEASLANRRAFLLVD